jgi:tetratricopeptide (TPR) repeat protein
MQANRHFARGDYLVAGAIYEQIAASARGDSMATMMLALCYEHQGRHSEALPLIEAAVRANPDCLEALQAAARVAVALEDHDKAAGYLRRALALPEVRAEIPRETELFKFLTRLVRVLISLPILRRRIRREALNDLDPGARALELQTWKHWAEGYLAWHTGTEPPNRDQPVH